MTSRPTTTTPAWTAHSRPLTGRPFTAQSRPTTTRPQTGAPARHESNYVIAVLEGRGVAREVGLAALDRETGKVIVVQLADNQSYIKTLHQMHLHWPSLILVPDTFLSTTDLASTRLTTTSLLVQRMQEEFPHIPIEPVARKFWNNTAGLELIHQLCIEDEERAATLVSASNKYYGLSAACALLKHAELRLNTRFAARTLRIQCIAIDGSMVVDVDTARNLELVGSATRHRSGASLFGVMNHTYTAMAARLLRVNILSPNTCM
jgi:DNA mismatch repair protein MSH4